MASETLKQFSEFLKSKRLETRHDAFYHIGKSLIELNRPVTIVETGTARKKDNWTGDGQSTLIWDWILQHVGGHGVSIDRDLEACRIARTQVSKIVIWADDSLEALLNWFGDQDKPDLLYLDSFDYDDPFKAEAMLHHAGELAIAWKHLPNGCLIAVDDCFSEADGKHVLVQEFFRHKRIAPEFSSYVTIWRKGASSDNYTDQTIGGYTLKVRNNTKAE